MSIVGLEHNGTIPVTRSGEPADENRYKYKFSAHNVNSLIKCYCSCDKYTLISFIIRKGKSEKIIIRNILNSNLKKVG